MSSAVAIESSWTKSIAETFQHFDVKEQAGLSTGQVKDAQEKYGPNGKHDNLHNMHDMMMRRQKFATP